MKKILALILALIVALVVALVVFASVAFAAKGPSPRVICSNGGCDSGGQPSCNWGSYGSVWYDAQGNRYWCGLYANEQGSGQNPYWHWQG